MMTVSWEEAVRCSWISSFVRLKTSEAMVGKSHQPAIPFMYSGGSGGGGDSTSLNAVGGVRPWWLWWKNNNPSLKIDGDHRDHIA